MRPFRLLSLSLAALLSSTALAQGVEPAIDTKKVRAEGREAVAAGKFDVAIASFQKLTELNPKDAEAWHMLGYSLHSAKRLDEALTAHMKATEFPATAPVATYNIACVHALRGKTDEAFTWLEKAIKLGFGDAEQMQADEDLASLRKDPRWQKLVAAVEAGGGNRIQAFAQNIERKSTRIAWFDRRSSPGQIAIDWSPVAWQAKFDELISSGKQHGKKWRLGADFWTTLDTSIDLQLGAVAVPAGYYYLTLEQRDAETFVLALHDAAAVRKQKLDAFQAGKLQGGIEVPLAHGKGETAERLQIDLQMDEGSLTQGSLTIAFGGHRLTAPLTVQIK